MNPEERYDGFVRNQALKKSSQSKRPMIMDMLLHLLQTLLPKMVRHYQKQKMELKLYFHRSKMKTYQNLLNLEKHQIKSVIFSCENLAFTNANALENL